MKFRSGQRVRKLGGYPFPGIVEAVFMATQIDGTRVERVVVNQTVMSVEGERATGLLHIFAPEQMVIEGDFEAATPEEADEIERNIRYRSKYGRGQ